MYRKKKRDVFSFNCLIWKSLFVFALCIVMSGRKKGKDRMTILYSEALEKKRNKVATTKFQAGMPLKYQRIERPQTVQVVKLHE